MLPRGSFLRKHCSTPPDGDSIYALRDLRSLSDKLPGNCSSEFDPTRDLVSLLPLPGDLASERAPGNVLVRELGGDLVLPWRGGEVAHIDRPVLVVQAVDLCLAGTLEKWTFENV